MLYARSFESQQGRQYSFAQQRPLETSGVANINARCCDEEYTYAMRAVAADPGALGLGPWLIIRYADVA